MADYDSRLRQLEARVASAHGEDSTEYGSELIRRRTLELLGPEKLAELQSQPPDPEIQALFAAILANAKAAKGRR